jgi:hypothetical protein
MLMIKSNCGKNGPCPLISLINESISVNTLFEYLGNSLIDTQTNQDEQVSHSLFSDANEGTSKPYD